jgi:hypothetical protein
MRISEIFQLQKTQYELDFVDIDTGSDTPLFIDPYFLAMREDPWSIDASRTIRSFFQHLITLLQAGEIDNARELFSYLSEPNETRLGLSRNEPQGRGIGPVEADKLFISLLESQAVQSGVVEDLEDCRVFVRGIDKDKTSDMATNIIRGHLIQYTKAQCNLWGIPLYRDVPSGFMWNRSKRQWDQVHTEMLVVNDQKVLLVPKAVVSYAQRYSAQRYHRHFVLNFLQNEHLRWNSSLVRHDRRRDGTERVWVAKKDIEEEVAPMTKEFLAKFTQDHPEVFERFKTQSSQNLESISNEEITSADFDSVVDYLIAELNRIPRGSKDATRYHRTVTGIMELIFYPNLSSPQIEREIHSGRKRIDITFDNCAGSGFFYRLHNTHSIPSSFIFVECKNYKNDVANPELDQLSGRFGVNKGEFGLLLCREIDDLHTFLSRCADTYEDGRGLVIPLVDADLIGLLNALKAGTKRPEEILLQERFREIALR